MGFSTHCTIVCITLIMQFSHCYCFASERKVASAKCLVWFLWVLCTWYCSLYYIIPSCFASERKVTFAMLRPSCLMCQPFIIGSSLSQEMIHETSTATDCEYSLVAQNQCIGSNQDHDYIHEKGRP